MSVREIVQEMQSPSMESLSTSIEVQTGNSVEALTFWEESVVGQYQVPPQKTRSQISKLKENWDDSTVSSNRSKLRIQNRLEVSKKECLVEGRKDIKQKQMQPRSTGEMKNTDASSQATSVPLINSSKEDL